MRNQTKPNAVVSYVDIWVVLHALSRIRHLVYEPDCLDEVLEGKGSNQLTVFERPTGEPGEC